MTGLKLSHGGHGQASCKSADLFAVLLQNSEAGHARTAKVIDRTRKQLLNVSVKSS